jgi:hypothetical protein
MNIEYDIEIRDRNGELELGLPMPGFLRRTIEGTEHDLNEYIKLAIEDIRSWHSQNLCEGVDPVEYLRDCAIMLGRTRQILELDDTAKGERVRGDKRRNA